jgi:hypothetical protein
MQCEDAQDAVCRRFETLEHEIYAMIDGPPSLQRHRRARRRPKAVRRAQWLAPARPRAWRSELQSSARPAPLLLRTSVALARLRSASSVRLRAGHQDMPLLLSRSRLTAPRRVRACRCAALSPHGAQPTLFIKAHKRAECRRMPL